MNFIERFIRKYKQKKNNKELMNYFSEEYRQQLINEHKLVVATAAQLSARVTQYVGKHSADVVQMYSDQLKIRKLELEAKIDVLTEFLNG